MPILIPTAEPFFFPGGRTGCLLVHGFTGTPREMRLLGEYLSAEGHTVLGIRLAGHATCSEDMIRSRWRDWLACVEDGYHLLSGVTERLFVMGLSMGGILSLLFASQYPVTGVVAMSTPHHLPKDPRLPFIKLLSLVQRFTPKGPPQWVDMQAYAEHVSYALEPTRAYAEVRDLLVEMRAVLPRVTTPVLLIYSRQDPTVKAEDGHAEAIYHALGSQDKKILWIENSGHVITRDQQRLQVFQAAVDFIRRVSS